MVDVGGKRVSTREARASARVVMQKAVIEKLLSRALPKGDVLTTAKIAGLLAAKRTPDLIPLTHPLALDHVDVTFDVDPSAGTIRIMATVRCQGRTGVEIEAMTACAVAALTIYDMCKSADKGIVIEAIQLEQKSGGKSGSYRRE